jgi:hypothetical protein
MNLLARLGAVLVIASIVELAGCGVDGGETPGSERRTTRVERTTLDGIIDRIAYDQTVLVRTRGFNAGRTIQQMQRANFSLRSVEPSLGRSDLGVPASTRTATREAVVAMGLALDDAVECLQSHVDTSACETVISRLRVRTHALGTELGHLIPYGTRSAGEVRRSLD